MVIALSALAVTIRPCINLLEVVGGTIAGDITDSTIATAPDAVESETVVRVDPVALLIILNVAEEPAVVLYTIDVYVIGW